MFRKLLVSLVLVGVLLSANACFGSSEKPAEHSDIFLPLEEFQNQAHIDVAMEAEVGEELKVILGANPTSGFQWQENVGIEDESVVRQTEHRFMASQTDVIGSPGQDIWTFEALKKGTTIISIECSRPWKDRDLGTWKITITTTIKQRMMKIRKNLLKFGAIAGIVALASAVVLAGVLPALAASTVDDYTIVDGVSYLPGDEVVELRDQYSETFYEGNSRYSRRIFLGSINYEDDGGNFQPINTAIVPSDSPNWDWEVTTGHWQLFINNDTTVGVKKGNNWIGTRFHGIAYLDVVSKDWTVLQTTNNVTPVVTGNTITWYNILYGIDYVLHYTNDSLKEDIIIHQEARDLLSSVGYRPSDYGYLASNTYLVPIFKYDWSQSLSMKLVWEALDNFEILVSPNEVETDKAIYFEAAVEDPYWGTKLVSFLPVYMATSVNPTNPTDPKEDWEYASTVMRKRLILKNDKHWLLTGVPVLELNQMPEGSIIFDPTETLRPSAVGDVTQLGRSGGTANWQMVDDTTPDGDSTTVYTSDPTILSGYDLYNVPNTSSGGIINFITVYTRSRRSQSAGTANTYTKIKTGGSEYNGTSTTLTTIYADYSTQYTDNPKTSNAWTWSEIDALQIGIYLSITSAVWNSFCTQVYVVVDYTPPDPPTVTTQAATVVEDTTATGNGNITVTGGENADYRGIAWDTTSRGDPGTLSPAASAYANYSSEGPGSYGTGAFTRSMTSLSAGTTIYARAYAHNSADWNWGSEVSFLTKPAAPTGIAATDGSYTDKVVVTWTKSTGATNYRVYEGANDISGLLGDVATYDDTTAPAGIVTPGTATASDGTSPDHITLSLAGESVADGATRTYKVVASNATGNSDDSSTNTGYRTTGVITYAWQRSAADSDGSFSPVSGGTTDPYNDTGAPSNGDGRWYYCEVSATGTTTQDSTHNRGYRIAVPTVTTQVATNIEDTTATGNGNITDTANGNCSAWGIVWNTTGNPTTADNTVAGSGDGSTGAFTANLTSLPTGTTIHTKAYATNLAGTGYGTEEDFLTKPAAPTSISATDGSYTDKVVITWVKSTGATDYHVWRDTTDLGSAGDVATFDDSGADAGTITNAGTVTASDGTSTAHVTLSLASEATSNGTNHTYKVVASNATGDSDDSLTDTGYRGVGAITYQWQRSAADSDAGYGNIGSGTTDPYNDTGAPAGVITPGTATASDGSSTAYVTLSLAGESVADGAGRYFQCVVSSTGASNSPQTSNSNRGYRTTGALTYQWQRSSGDSDADYSNIGGGTTDPYNDTAAPAGVITPGSAVATDHIHTDKVALNLAGESVANGVGRYFQCVLSATGTSDQTSTADRGYRTTGSLTYQWQVDDGGGYDNIVGAITEAYDYTDAPPPTITAGNTVATDGTETAHTALSLAGTSLNDGTTYDYRCILNATGTTQQTSASDTGETGGGSLSYQWQKSSGTGDTDYSNLDGATSSTYNDTAAPAGSITNAGTVTATVDEDLYVTLSLTGETTANGAVRYFKCVLSSADAVGQTSGSNDGYRGVGAITYAWQRSVADSDASYSPIGGGTTDPYNDTDAPAGTITPGITTASDGIAEAYVTLVVSGHTTNNGAGRYFKCITSSVDASNTPQTSNNNRGYRTVGTITFQWQRSATDSDAGYGNIAGTTNPYNDTNAPANGDGRYFRSLLDATGAVQATTVVNRGYRATSGYEQLIIGDDADGDDIYGVNWTAQQFTAGSVSHTVIAARVKIKRVGSPGTVTLSLKDANAIYHPIGSDLLGGTLDGDTLSTDATWYEFTFTTEISIEAGELYALVMRASSGDAANYIEWRWDSEGGLADAIASLSDDAGITWTVDAGGADYLFEIRGHPLIEMIGAQVFSGYIETGDWLIALTYDNKYVPYYPNETSAAYFSFQLLDGIVVESQASCLAWGRRPGSIYLSKALADTLEWGATDYTIRLYGNFGTNPAAGYLLTSIDWRGTNLELLDDWVIAQAKDIGTDIGVTLVEAIADQGEVLNSYGHALFSIGIPQLNVVRPELFELVGRQPEYTEEDFTGDLQGEIDWEVRLGPQIAKVLTDWGDLIGVDGDFMGGILTFIVFITVVGILSLTGHIGIGLALGYPVLLTGAWFGVVSWVIIGVITFLMAIIFIYKIWLIR